MYKHETDMHYRLRLALQQVQRLAWLCDELAAGNAFPLDNYRNWADAARIELQRDGNRRMIAKWHD